ncbi:hypothetical protein FOL47_000526 [Perkinsus chesapeaki]|uniref:CCHC-type domain-containing protein n=1 Tax=Perkinsus chesapeaki TaxID=330153 RepID=A0A7J6KXF1_PERCH|nr:hypothetical protein FOL47_000526 [Perkinsus chesapeaki]
MSTVESESRGALESDSEHGASSENSVDTETPLSATFSSDLLKSALKRAARKTYSVSWDETLSSAPKHSCLQLAEALLGCRSKSPCWTYLNFVNTEGRPLGTGVLAVCKAWGIKAHPDAPKEMGFHIDRMEKPKSWSWSVFKRKVEICVQASEGSTSPLRILLYSCTLPRFVVAQLKEMLVKEVRTDDDPAKVNTDSPLLNWQKVEDPDDTEYVGDDYLQRVQELYTGWISCCDRIAQKVENLMLEDDSRKEDSNPVLLMRRWCNLASRGGKMELGKIIDEETFLHGRLSTVCTGHVTISWKARIELYKLALQSFPRFREKDTGFSVFVGSLADESANINDTQDLARAVQRLADSSGCSTVDEYLGLDQDGSSTGKRSHSTSSDIPHRTHHNESKRPRTGEGKNRAPSRELASVKLGLPADLIKTRFDAGLCLRCGHTGHKVRDCPNAVSGSPGASVSSASEYPKRDVALLSLDSRTGKVSPQTLLTVPVRLINPHSVKGDSVPALAGLDTMSSVNLVESSLVRKLQCDLSDCPSHIRTVNGSVTAEASTFITVCLSGYIAELPFVVVSGLPRVDLLVGHSWLPQLGVTFSIPKPHSEEGELRVRDLYSPVTDQIRAAEESLVGRLGDIHALPGAPHYFGRLRRARTIANGEERADRLDDPRQSMVYEVWCDTSSVANHRQKPKSGHNVPFPPADFSKPLIGKLSVGQQAQFRAELQTFIDKGWWAEVPPSVAPELLRERYDQTQSPFRYPAVSFPIIQKAHKSTRCRLVTDCRQCNQFLAPASYEGFSVTDCISLIRANWRDCYALGFLDLSKAFYKVHLGDDGRLLILADGRTFECSRLAFGLVHGPASLSGQVLVLLNASFSGLMGRPINCTSTRAFVGLLPGLFVIPYYDDIIIFGLPHMCQRMAHILTSIAPLIGACFPEDKTDWVDSNKGVFRHLGCLWSRGTLGELYIQCPPAEEDSLTLDSPFSRRRIFQIAGARYDGIRLHPVARLVADKLRRWAGTSPYGNSRKGWDHKWTLPDRSLDSLRSLIAQGESDNFGHCQHTGVPPHHRHIFGFCDASDEGWGFLAYTGVLVPRTFPPDLSESNPAFHLLEACAGEWSPSNGSSKWHINRKEAHALFRCLECIYEWLNRFLDATSRFDSITVFCDNTSALSWALKTGPAARTYDRVALERLTGSLAELREAISQKFGVVVELRHISGLHNYLADQLSRHPSLGIPLPSLGSDDGCEAQSANEALGSHTSAEERPAAFTFLVVTDTEEAATVFDRGSSHKYALVEPLDLCLSSEEVHNGVTLLISSPSSENGGEVSHIEDSLNQLRPHDPAELRGIGDMSEEDILSHVSDVLRDSIRASEAKIANVPVTEILASLRAPHTQVAHSGFPEPSEASENLVQGSGHGPYLRWDSENGQKGGEIAPHIHDYINLVYSVFTLSRSERALNAEMVSAARHQPKFAFRCGDTVRLSRWINGRRETTGPYTILKQDEGNSLLYHLVGRDSPAPVSQLLPYIADIHRDAFDYAVRPSQDRLAVIIKDKLPGGVDPADLQDGVHWLLFSVDDTENDELVKRIYVAKFLHHSNRRGALVVQGLDRQADGSWKLPPRDERTSTQSTIAEESILGGRGFLPSRGGWRIPRPVKVWFNSCGVNL